MENLQNNTSQDAIIDDDISYLIDTKIAIPDEVLITKTEAKDKYLLTDKDLTVLSYQTSSTKKFKRVVVKLYKLTDIREIAKKKWESEMGIQNEIQKRTNRKLKIKQEKESKNEVRRQLLNKELAKYALTIRDDSKLCNGYINGSLKDWSLEEVVEKTLQIRWLYEHTNYSEELDSHIKDEYKYEGHCDYQEATDEVQSSIIKEYGKGAPWLTCHIIDP